MLVQPRDACHSLLPKLASLARAIARCVVLHRRPRVRPPTHQPHTRTGFFDAIGKAISDSMANDSTLSKPVNPGFSFPTRTHLAALSASLYTAVRSVLAHYARARAHTHTHTHTHTHIIVGSSKVAACDGERMGSNIHDIQNVNNTCRATRASPKRPPPSSHSPRSTERNHFRAHIQTHLCVLPPSVCVCVCVCLCVGVGVCKDRFREGYDGPEQKQINFQPSGTVVVSSAHTHTHTHTHLGEHSVLPSAKGV